MNENDFVTDEEIDQMYGQQQAASQQQPQLMMPGQPIGVVNGVPVYPLSLAQVPSLVPAAPAAEGMLTRRLGPLPVWGWGLGALALGVGGYFFWQQSQKKVEKNDGEEDDDRGAPALPSSGGSEGGGWGPSRGTFAGVLQKHFMRTGMGNRVTIFDDADDAVAKGLKHVSPLINLKVEGSYKPDKDLVKLCKREGLNPIAHEDGTIGLYPLSSGKRGKAWEEYIDLLRDDGQKA